MESCVNCKFWEAHSPDVLHLDAIQIGLCKRRAPLVLPEDKFSNPQWPTTRHSDWCGDFHAALALDEFEINW
jgi:hypothetical protein